jgi:hypothetical protein
MTEETRAVLTNSELIALNQDPLGLQAALIRREESGIDVLAKPLASCGARAAVLWNRGDLDATVTVRWEELWLQPGPATVQDLWANVPLPAGVSVSVRVSSTVVL